MTPRPRSPRPSRGPSLTLLFIACFATLAPGPGSAMANETLERELRSRPGQDLWIEIASDIGEVWIAPSDHTEKGRVEIEYDADKVETELEFEPELGELFVKLDRKGLFKSIKSDDDDASIEIRIPKEANVHLDIRLKAGRLTMNLDDLEVAKLELRVDAGDCEVDFGKSSTRPGDDLDISLRVGELTALNLGSRRFQKARIHCGVGDMLVDFTGGDAFSGAIEIDQRIGEMRLVLPRESGVSMEVSKWGFLSDLELPRGFRKSGKRYYSSNYDDAGRQLEFDVSAGIGEVEIDWKD